MIIATSIFCWQTTFRSCLGHENPRSKGNIPFENFAVERGPIHAEQLEGAFLSQSAHNAHSQLSAVCRQKSLPDAAGFEANSGPVRPNRASGELAIALKSGASPSDKTFDKGEEP